MHRFTRRRRWIFGKPLSLVAGSIVILTASICSDVQQGIIQECRYNLSNNWPSGQRSFDPKNQASCPIHTPPGGRDQSYQAIAALPSHSTVGSGTLTFTDYHGNTVTVSSSVLYSCCDTYVFTGHYTAGTIAAPSGTTAYDQAWNMIGLTAGGVGTVTANLGYQTTAPAGILGSGSVDPGASTTLTGEFYESDLVPPVGYQWYRDGTPISGATNETLDAWGGDPNTTDAYEFQVTDSQNRMVSASKSVFTSCGVPDWQNNVYYHEEDIVCYGAQRWQSTLEGNIGYVPYEGSPYWTLVQ